MIQKNIIKLEILEILKSNSNLKIDELISQLIPSRKYLQNLIDELRMSGYGIVEYDGVYNYTENKADIMKFCATMVEEERKLNKIVGGLNRTVSTGGVQENIRVSTIDTTKVDLPIIVENLNQQVDNKLIDNKCEVGKRKIKVSDEIQKKVIEFKLKNSNLTNKEISKSLGYISTTSVSYIIKANKLGISYEELRDKKKK